MDSELKLTIVDRQILNSYKKIIDSLGDYLGSAAEVILHDLSSYDHSVIAIKNGHYTGRSVGAPITNKALNMLEELNNNTSKDGITYFSTNKDGSPMKSTTIAIRGENDRVIGLICINLYLNIPIATLLGEFTPYTENTLTQLSTAPGNVVSEEFSENATEVIHNTIESIRQRVYTDNSVSASNKNKIIIKELYDRGIFRFKDAIQIIASELNISKNTVYLHLGKFKKS